MSGNELTSEQSAATPEAAIFQSLSPAAQRQILSEYPRLLARAAHGYSIGADCEAVVRAMLEGAAPLLRVRNKQGDAPIASALIRGQQDRANWLIELANDKNPTALTDRARHRETLLMLGTAALPDSQLERLLERDPTELHRLYDSDGRNLLHHCSLEDSTRALETILRCLARLMQEGKLDAAKVAQAVNMNDRNGDTPLHLMAAGNRHDMLRLLLNFSAEAGVDVCLDARRHVGNRWTPLMAAVAADALECVQLLLDEGADLDETDVEGRSAAELLASGQSKVAALLASLEPYVPAADPATSVPSAASAVDSGIQSVPGREQPPQQPRQRQHPGQSLEDLDARLCVSGKSEAFLDAISRLSNGQFQTGILPLADKPITTAFSLWSHSGPVPRELVLRALEEVGESAYWMEN